LGPRQSLTAVTLLTGIWPEGFERQVLTGLNSSKSIRFGNLGILVYVEERYRTRDPRANPEPAQVVHPVVYGIYREPSRR
jgi:hypothetical protein